MKANALKLQVNISVALNLFVIHVKNLRPWYGGSSKLFIANFTYSKIQIPFYPKRHYRLPTEKATEKMTHSSNKLC